MNQLSGPVFQFFGDLTIDEDQRGHHYKDFIEAAVARFLKDERKETAYGVYRIFLDCYGYAVSGQGINVLSLLEKMRSYEESAATLTRKQRDHFVHSVNVFLLGLAIYQCKPGYREVFQSRCYDAEPYDGRRQTPREEFFFRWGIAALCHDIGYPVEIITNQVNDFINFSSQFREADRRIFAHVEYDRFDLVNTIPEEVKKHQFIDRYHRQHYETCVYVDLLRPVDLLAHKLHLSLGVDLPAIKERLDSYVAESGRSGRVDHGFFSALMLLKWYGYLIQVSGASPDHLFYPILDSASAILLHNFFSISLVANTKRPNAFSLPPMKPEQHPLAYLLILCDELQEWNREPYGEEDLVRVGVSSATIHPEGDQLVVTYLVEKGTMPEEFVGKKTGTLNSLLDFSELYPGGLCVGCDTVLDLPLPEEAEALLTMEELENLAIAIHNRYNQIAKELDPEKQINYPNFTDLPKERKYYNVRTAMSYPEILALVGCEVRPLGGDGEPVQTFTDAEVEILAENEHQRWMAGRAEKGWRYGPDRDEEKKTNPYMVPYGALSEEVKELDRRPARSIPALLANIGLGVYRKQSETIDSFTPEQVELLARRIHGYYNERQANTDPQAKLASFDEISPELQNSNRRQARGIPNKLRHIGCVLLPKGAFGHGEPVTSFPTETIEMLARIEHDEWTGEKVANGWQYGPVKDSVNRKNPYMVDYDQLSEAIKEYDRDAIRNMPALADACGYAIYKK